MKIAILDDYLRLSLASADWSDIAARCEITVFDRSLADAEDAAEVLAPFDILCLLRERMPITDALMARLPNLKLISITGPYCRVLDAAAAGRRAPASRSPAAHSGCSASAGKVGTWCRSRRRSAWR